MRCLRGFSILMILVIVPVAEASNRSFECGKVLNPNLGTPRALQFRMTNVGDCSAQIEAFDAVNQSGSTLMDITLMPNESVEVNRLSPLAASVRITTGIEGSNGPSICVTPLVANSDPMAAYWGRLENTIYAANGQVGNVGIGTKFPRALLDVSGAAVVGELGVGAEPWPSTQLTVGDVNNPPQGGMRVWARDFGLSVLMDNPPFDPNLGQTLNSTLCKTVLEMGDRNWIRLAFNEEDTPGDTRFGSAIAGVVESPSGVRMSGLSFWTTPSSAPIEEKMRISAAGNVGIGTTSPGERLDVVGNIRATGTIGQCSDRRYKRDIDPLSNVLESLEELRSVRFSWDESFDGGEEAGPQVGLIAQEVELVFPELVSKDNRGYLSVDYGKMTSVLLAAIKEQQVQIGDLKRQLARFREAHTAN